MSEPPSSTGPVSLSRYRPVLYLLTGVVAAYALLQIHHGLVAPSPPQTPLRRRGAVRRARRHDYDEAEIVDTPSYRAINHLTQLERENGVYGTFRIETADGRRVESGLLPSLLATRDQLMEEVGVPPADAERMRETMEDTFLESFLALDFPPSHTIREGSAEREYLVEELQRRGISRVSIQRAIERFNADSNYGEQLRRRRQNGERVTLATSAAADPSTPAQNFDGGETMMDEQSVFSWRDGNNDSSPSREGQNLLNLLYHIAEDQARRDGYIHRGVTCNSCGAMPIQGIRYRCANCIDYDLCETCEAMQVHIKTHLFYKVRIPAPFLGNPRQSQPVWYPGKPMMLPRSLPRPLAKRLMKETNFENTELDALWDQFRCLANVEWVNDPNKLYMAIDRKTFDRCFVPNTSIRPPPPSLIYDRMFAFYDTNGDNLIGFEEFLKGLASFNNKSADERMRRIFNGYDIDRDGYVERKDFLRMFRAYYALSRELTRDMVAGMEDDFLEGGARDVVLGSQPISSAFPGSIPSGEASRTGEGKRTNLEGDMEIIDNQGVLRPDGTDSADRNAIIGDAAVREQFGRVRPVFPSTVRLSGVNPRQSQPTVTSDSDDDDDDDEDDDEDNEDSDEDQSSSSVASDFWPPAEHILEEDIVNALGAYVPLYEVTDHVDRARIGTAVYHRMHDEDQRRVEEARREGIHERWRRRAFYIDEEDGATAPEGFQEDSDVDGMSDDEDVVEQQHPESESHPPSPRSRSSSKVRFQDDVADDYDVRSNPSTSSRSIPVGERWGGFEIPEVERDAGKEILYQVTQQGLNELLDILFKPKEDLLMEAYRTRAERKRWAREIELVEQMDPKKNAARKDAAAIGRDNEVEEQEKPAHDKSLEELLQEAGYSVIPQSPELVRPEPVLSPTVAEPVIEDDDVRPTHLRAPSEDGENLTDPTIPQNRPDGSAMEYFPPPPESPEVHAVEDDDDDKDLPSRITSPFDPTLPQHRPDDDDLVDEQQTESSPSRGNSHTPPPQRQREQFPMRLRFEPNGLTSFPAPRSPSSSSPEAEATAPKFSPSPPKQILTPSASASQSQSQPQASPTIQPQQAPPRPPSPQTLSRWALLNQVEREAKERGGSGAKLNFEEFSRRMNTERGRKLAFVGSWIEMASF
ncbi:hypothetical protein VTN00DRAFT_790 [Thermoascus crustaceus]|uniref:uncharacterized protein n=1 Tax=Thermoascus crustaceus TaxID=5088 RepID=UPI00374457C7